MQGNPEVLSENLKERIQECGKRLFGMRGYRETSINDIVSELGISKGAFYYYYKDKEELLFKITAASQQRLLNDSREITENLSLTTLEKLAKAVEALLSEVLCESTEYFTYVQEYRYLKDEHKESSLSWRRSYLMTIKEIVQEGVDNGSFCKDIDVTMTSFAIVGMCMWTAQWYKPKGRYSPREIAKHFYETVLTGIVSAEESPSEEK